MINWLEKFSNENESINYFDDLVSIITEIYSVTNNPCLTTWILPDGRMIDTTNSIKDLSEIKTYQKEYLDSCEFSNKFILDGVVKISNDTVIIGKEPSEDQLKSIENVVGENEEYSILIYDGNEMSLYQDSLDGQSITSCIKEYYEKKNSNSNIVKKAFSLPRGHFDGLVATLEAMKPSFITASSSDMDDLGSVNSKLTNEISSRVWEGMPKVVSCDKLDNEVRFIVIDYFTLEIAEVIVRNINCKIKNDDDVEVISVDSECQSEEIEVPELASEKVCLSSFLRKRLNVKMDDQGIKIVKILRERHYRSGFILRDEIWSLNNEETLMKRMAYNPSGDFIGDSKEAFFLCVKKGIRPEKAYTSSNVCSIGYSNKYKKWYGWSHRAICGFKIGDMLFDGSCDSSTPYLKCGIKKIENLNDAKQAAINFSMYVS